MKTRSKLTSHKGKQVHREKQPLVSLLKNNSNTVEREKPKEINKMTNMSERVIFSTHITPGWHFL